MFSPSTETDLTIELLDGQGRGHLFVHQIQPVSDEIGHRARRTPLNVHRKVNIAEQVNGELAIYDPILFARRDVEMC